MEKNADNLGLNVLRQMQKRQEQLRKAPGPNTDDYYYIDGECWHVFCVLCLFVDGVGLGNQNCVRCRVCADNCLSREAFYDGIFELVDLWTQTIFVDEYISFLKQLRYRISAPFQQAMEEVTTP